MLNVCVAIPTDWLAKSSLSKLSCTHGRSSESVMMCHAQCTKKLGTQMLSMYALVWAYMPEWTKSQPSLLLNDDDEPCVIKLFCAL